MPDRRQFQPCCRVAKADTCIVHATSPADDNRYHLFSSTLAMSGPREIDVSARHTHRCLLRAAASGNSRDSSLTSPQLHASSRTHLVSDHLAPYSPPSLPHHHLTALHLTTPIPFPPIPLFTTSTCFTSRFSPHFTSPQPLLSPFPKHSFPLSPLS